MRITLAVLLVVPVLTDAHRRGHPSPQPATPAFASSEGLVLPRTSSALSVAPQGMFSNILGAQGPMPSYSVSQPSKDTTLTQIRWPMCFGKHSAMLGRQVDGLILMLISSSLSFFAQYASAQSSRVDLPAKRALLHALTSPRFGSFCVAPQGSGDAHKYELKVDLQSAPGASVSLFLFGDEGDAYGRFWKDAIANKVSRSEGLGENLSGAGKCCSMFVLVSHTSD
jgi:hypothetical protein